MVGYVKGKHGHADVHSSRIAHDEKDVAAMVGLIKNWTDLFAGHMQLSGISAGVIATTAMAKNLATAYKVGEAAYADFKKTLLESQPLTERFNDKVKTQKLKSFSALSKTKTVTKASKGT